MPTLSELFTEFPFEVKGSVPVGIGISGIASDSRKVEPGERMRMERLLPADLKPRIGEFTVPQLVSLRLASDAERPSSRAKCSTKRSRIARPSSAW